MDLIKALERTRPEYKAELAFHSFLLDAYTGGGGFEGRVQRRDPASVSELCSAYGDVDRKSYLDKFPAESVEKFAARCDAAHYDNYAGPLTDLKVAFMLAKSFSVSDRPDAVQAWHDDIDGKGTTFEEALPGPVLRAALFGWNPAVVDLPSVDVEVKTAADADAAGLGQPSLITLTPANLLDFEKDDSSNFAWAKIRTVEERRDGWSGEPYRVDVYTIWNRATFSKYEVTDGGNGAAAKSVTVLAEDKPHDFGRVPVTILRHKQSPLGSMLGMPMHGEVSQANRALFNRVSELEEVLRQSAFPILELPTAETAEDGQRVVAADQGLTVGHDWKNTHKYVETTGQSAESLETRIRNTIREIYRMAGVEYDRDSGVEASGEARQYDFAQTNAKIADYAGNVALWIADVDDLVGTAKGVSEELRKKQRISPPKNFDVENITALVTNAKAAIDLRLGATATRLIKQRVAGQLLPDVSPDDADAITDELQAEADATEQDAAMTAEIDAAGNVPPPGTPPGAPPVVPPEQAPAQ